MSIDSHRVTVESGSEDEVVYFGVWIFKLYNVSYVCFHLLIIKQVFWSVPCAVKYVLFFQWNHILQFFKLSGNEFNSALYQFYYQLLQPQLHIDLHCCEITEFLTTSIPQIHIHLFTLFCKQILKSLYHFRQINLVICLAVL